MSNVCLSPVFTSDANRSIKEAYALVKTASISISVYLMLMFIEVMVDMSIKCVLIG